MILLCALLRSSDKKLIWLTPDDVNQKEQIGLLTQLKSKFKNLTWPMWSRFYLSAPEVEFDTENHTFSRIAVEQLNLGSPFITNENGLRAWILSPSQLNIFHQHLKTNFGFWSIKGFPVQTRDKLASSVMGLKSINANNNPARTTGENHVSLGININLTPKILSDSVRVLVNANYTYRPSAENAIGRTNLAVACQVLVPNGGAFIVDSGNATNSSSEVYMLIIAATIVDGNGKPVKP